MDSWRAVSIPPLPGRGPDPRIHDTATGELVLAAAGPTATMYACGITPYDATHIGHAATFLAWDLLVRAWRDAGHNVICVQNVTDVDDPLLERADHDGEDWRELADREIARYRADMEALRVLPPAWSAPLRRCRSSSSSPAGWPSAGRSTTWRAIFISPGPRTPTSGRCRGS